MASKKHQITVIGSLNIDFITRTSRLPHPGETFAALSFDTGFGGKGANQAVACARLAGSDVSVLMVGRVGDDSFGRDYLEALEKEGIDPWGVVMLKREKTGVTNIIVDEVSGENRILFVGNANERFGPETEEPMYGDVVVFQLEIPLKTVSLDRFNSVKNVMLISVLGSTQYAESKRCWKTCHSQSGTCC
jgi:ribokinase